MKKIKEKSWCRRNMLKLSCGAFLSSQMLSNIKASRGSFHKSILTDFGRLSWKAYETVTHEGSLNRISIEGKLPYHLSGRFLRIGPGQSENNGTVLNHFFDGDAYVVDLEFKKGSVTGKSLFINTPERENEKRAGQMIYNEFGTKAPQRTRQLKKQANVNLISWGDDHLLTLNEGSAPCLIKRDTLEFVRYEDFDGILPKNVSFSGHPKFDPQTGLGYSFGLEQGIRKSIYVFEFNNKKKTLKVLYKLPQRKLYLIHDMLMSENLLAFYLPPVHFKISDILINAEPIANSLHYDESIGGKLLVVSKDGKMRPRYLPMPKRVIFHHGNAYEQKGRLHFVSFAAKGMGLIDYISQWNKKNDSSFSMPGMTKFSVDLEGDDPWEEDVFLPNHDFPHFDQNHAGTQHETLFALHGGDERDPISFPSVSKVNLETGKILNLKARSHETFGEALLCREGSKDNQKGENYLLIPGYNGERDESFIDIVESDDMERLGRVWLGMRLPLGFHGLFLNSENY